jgi:hypothetical protein
MSDGSCRVAGLLSVLRYQQNIRAGSASAQPLNGYRSTRKRVGLWSLRPEGRILVHDESSPAPGDPSLLEHRLGPVYESTTVRPSESFRFTFSLCRFCVACSYGQLYGMRQDASGAN